MSQTYWWQIGNLDSANGTGYPPVSRTEGDREIIHREVSFELDADGDGRTLYTRIVPYNVPAEVADPPYFEPYIEMWKPGVFDKQLRAANRVDVLLNFEHEKGIGGVVGRGVELESKPDGLHGTFRLLSNTDGDKTRELVREKVLTGMSLEAIVLKSEKEEGATVRTEARLRNVAICRNPAIPGAEVLAVRSEEEPGEPEPAPDEPAPDEPAIVVPELVARDGIAELLERVGVVKLDRRPVTSEHWDGSPARFTDEEYERSALIVRPGDGPAKERCSLAVLEPSGELNINAMHLAAARLQNVANVTGLMRSDAARRLVRLYRSVGEEPPASLLSIAAR